MKHAWFATALVAASFATPAAAQQQPSITQAIAGTRLDISATGEATRVPDVAVITAGVITRSSTARAALEQNAARMDRVRSTSPRPRADAGWLCTVRRGGMGCGKGNTTVRQDEPLGNILDEPVCVPTLIVLQRTVISMRIRCGYFLSCSDY